MMESKLKIRVTGIKHDKAVELTEEVDELPPNEPGKVKVEFSQGVWSASVEIPTDANTSIESLAIVQIFRKVLGQQIEIIAPPSQQDARKGTKVDRRV